MRQVVLICGLTGLLTSCAKAPQVPNGDWSTMSMENRRQAIAEISRKCRWPADRMVVRGEQLEIKPDVNDDYEAVDCALKELKRLKGVKMGFIGNEAFVEPTK